MRKIWKKPLICIILSAFFAAIALQSVSAADSNGTVGINANYYTGDSFKYNDYIYMVNVDSDSEIILNYNNLYMVIKNATCEWKDRYYKFCADSISYDSSRRENKALIRVLSFEQDITVTRTITNSNPLVGEKVNFTVTIKNEGDSDAENVTYTDIFPTGINVSIPMRYNYEVKARDRKVTFSNGSVSSMKYVIWQGYLMQEESVTFVYEITPLKPITDTLIGKVHYKKAFDEVDKETTPVSFKAEPYFDIYTNIVDPDYEVTPGTTDIRSWEEKSTIHAGEYIFLVVNLVDRYNDNNSMKLPDIRFFLPDSVDYIRESSIRVYDNASHTNKSYLTAAVKLNKITDHLYNWSGTVLKGGKMFVLRLRAADKGDYRIRVSADVKKDNMPLILDYSVTRRLTITRNEIEVESNLQDGDTFNSGQTVYMTLYVTNPNTFTNITDMNISYNIPWHENGTKSVKLVKEANYYDILNTNVKMPTVASTTMLKYYVNVSYRTGMGERLNKTFLRTIVIAPLPAVQVLHDISSKVIQNSGSVEIGNEETEVTLRIKNQLDKDLESVLVTEAFDKRLNAEKEISNRLAMLRKGEILDAYRYKIKPPQSTRQQNFTLKTYIEYRWEDEIRNNSFDVQLSIMPKMMDIDVTKSKLETEVSRGQLMHLQYRIKNTENEAISNVTLHFPLQYGTDIVGARTFSIKQIPPGETVVVNEEVARAKSNGTLVIGSANVTFNDVYGNAFNKTSNTLSTEVLWAYVETPLIFADKTVEQNVVAGERFKTNLTVRNEGGKRAFVTVKDQGNDFSFLSEPGSIVSFVYDSTIEDIGFVDVHAAMLYYDDEGTKYYTASDRPSTYSKKGKAEAPAAVEQKPEEKPPVMEKKGINTKYIYLALFIIAACLVIWYIIKMKPKEKGFSFMEE